MIALLLLLAQFTPFGDHTDPRVVLQGYWQSCRGDEGTYAERVYENTAHGQRFELHLGPMDEFAIFAGARESHRDHAGPLNLLRPAYHAADVATWRGKRHWNVPSLGLWLSVVQAGGSRDECESYVIELVRQS